jgi:hypothetical protein
MDADHSAHVVVRNVGPNHAAKYLFLAPRFSPSGLATAFLGRFFRPGGFGCL